jgi:PAS domain S-box-containing protein
MKNYFTKSQERERLKELFSNNNLDAFPENTFGHLLELAANICETKYALLGFILDDQQWFKTRFGLDTIQEPRAISLCNLVIQQEEEIVIIEDARLDERFKDKPITTSNPNIVFYAGVPLIIPNGNVLGAICIFDDVPKKLTEIQVKSLKLIGVQVMALLENRLKAYESTCILERLEEANNELIQQSHILNDYKHAIDEAAIVAITDPEGIISYTNQKFCDISGYSKAELIGQNQRIVNSGFHNNEFWEDFWHTISAGKIWSGEIKNKTKYGVPYWVDTTVIPFLDPISKIPLKYLSIRKDITAYKDAKYHLFNSIINDQEQDREFLSNDINEGITQYLTAITYKIELLKELTQDNSTRNELNEIHSHLLNSIEELRMVTLQLMPRTLMQYGLIPALEQYYRPKKDYEQRLTIRYHKNYIDNLPNSIVITVYRTMISFLDFILKKTKQVHIQIDFQSNVSFMCKFKIQNLTDQSRINADIDAIKNKFAHFTKRIELCGGCTRVNYDYKNETTEIVFFFN